MGLTLGVLAENLGDELMGDPERVITHVGTLERAGPGGLSFLANTGYKKYLAATKSSAVILSSEDAQECPTSAIISANPYASFARAAALISPPAPLRQGVHATAIIGNDCEIDATAWVGPGCIIENSVRLGPGVQLAGGCYLGEGASIGSQGRVAANVTVCNGVTIGDRVIIHPGVVIGSDGFGFASEEGHWLKVPQSGGVSIGNDVEIGANTTIDRGAMDDTIIEDGVKLDNQIQIAHNVVIGAHTAIAGCVGISGSAKIGRHCMIAGGVGIVGHLEIADHVIVTGMSMVTKSITRAGIYSSGLPVQENALWNKNYARLRQLDKLARKLNKLAGKQNSEA